MVLLALFAVAAEPPAPPSMPDWAVLPPLRYMHDPDVTVPMTAFVVSEIKANRCIVPAAPSPPPPAAGPLVATPPADPRRSLTVDVAVLVGADGMVRMTVPHAIHCPTIEQYAAGLVSNFTRDNLVPHGPTDQWYRTSVTFRWAP